MICGRLVVLPEIETVDEVNPCVMVEYKETVYVVPALKPVRFILVVELVNVELDGTVVA